MIQTDRILNRALLHAIAYCDGHALAIEAGPRPESTTEARKWRARSAAYHAVLRKLTPRAKKAKEAEHAGCERNTSAG